MRSKLIIFMGLLFLSCEEIEFNPLDAVNPDYIPPETTIITDINASILDTSAVTISFEGNEAVTEYSYNLDSTGWSNWTDYSYATLDYLDEGLHTFSVKGRYVSMVEDETPANISFTVNAVTGPALMFYPRRHITRELNNPVTFQLIAYEVDSLMSATISLSYDTASLEIQSVGQGNMLTDTGESMFIDESASGSLTIHTIFMGGDSPYVSGTGTLASIQVKALVSGSHTLNLDGTQVFKTHTNRSISIQETVNGLVVVQ